MTIQPELAPVRAGEDLDWGALEAYLRAHLDDLPSEPMRVQQFPRGSANLTYMLTFGELQLVLRRPPFGKTAPGAHDMGREYSILSRLWRPYPRAPRAYVLCEDAAVIGARFVVQEYRSGGVVIFGDAPDDMAGLPDLGQRLTRAMAEALADLHKVDYAAAGLSDLGRPEGFVERQLSGWRDRWSRVAASDYAAEMERVAERLQREMPTSSLSSLVHNDYKLDNCQFHPGAPDTVVSVFDWDMATIGDPFIDVGITLAYWNFVRRRESLGLPSKQVFAETYAAAMGIDAAAFRWYEAFAHWRTAVAVQQLFDRYARGDSHDDRLAESGRMVPVLAERAEATLDGREV
jgi:aminoglycoside phosphotransferase (APT) family kinase protein